MRKRECIIYTHEYLFWDENVLGALPQVHGAQFTAHWNQPDIKRRCLALLHRSGCFDEFLRLAPPTLLQGKECSFPALANVDELLLVHDIEYIKKLQGLQGCGDFGEEAFFTSQTYDIVSRVAKMAINAAKKSCEERAITYVLTGCPGHHAEPSRARGFCILNYLAIAVASRLDLSQNSRFIIFDFDAHAPNGTQCKFANDPRILLISFHQAGCYPYDSDNGRHTGRLEQIGDFHNIINLPLPPGSGAGAYKYAIQHVLIPAVTRFGNCNGFFVSAGYDAGFMDPLARMNLGSRTFHYFGQIIQQLAHDFCQDTIFCFHEGGYSSAHVPFSCLAFLQGLCAQNNSQNIHCPFQDELDAMGPLNNELQPHQQTIIDRVAQQHQLHGLHGLQPQFEDSEVPAYFKCPLSLEIMRDPVYLHTDSGHSFERSMLQKELETNPYQDPITKVRYEHKLRFGPNRSLKDAIEDWKRKKSYHSPLIN